MIDPKKGTAALARYSRQVSPAPAHPYFKSFTPDSGRFFSESAIYPGMFIYGGERWPRLTFFTDQFFTVC